MASTGKDPVPVTAAGIRALHAEMAELREKRPHIVHRVASARAEGDLSENAAYHDARRDLGMLDGRLQTIEGILARAVEVEGDAEPGVVALGSRAVVRDEFGDSTYTLVGPVEADARRGLISVESPLGSALVGRRAGDTVTYETPGGPRQAEVVEVEAAPGGAAG